MQEDSESKYLKVDILNHRLYLTNLVEESEDLKSEHEQEETKRAKIEVLSPSDCLRNELSNPIRFDYDSLRIRSNFDTSDDSTSVSSENSCQSSPRRHGSQSPVDLPLNTISLYQKFFETEHTQDPPNFFLKPNLLKYNLNQLSLLKKDTLIFLIEKNVSLNIKSPFDIFAYNRLTNNSQLVQTKKICKNLYNFSSIKKLSKLLNYYKNPLNKKYLRENMLLPCNVGMFLMPFYFDIFKMSELNQFSQMEIDMILFLKRTYTTQIFLDYESLISNYKENILWNCFVLYKFKLNGIVKDKCDQVQVEFLNYFLALVYTLQHLEYVVNYIQSHSKLSNKLLKDHISKALELNRTIPFLFEALVLTGLFKHKDYLEYEKFSTNKLDSIITTSLDEYNLEKTYYENTLNSIKQSSENVFPLKLKNLCRIKIKNLMNKYDSTSISKLAVPKEIGKFLLYENELNNHYVKYKNSINFPFVHTN